MLPSLPLLLPLPPHAPRVRVSQVIMGYNLRFHFFWKQCLYHFCYYYFFVSAKAGVPFCELPSS